MRNLFYDLPDEIQEKIRIISNKLLFTSVINQIKELYNNKSGNNLQERCMFVAMGFEFFWWNHKYRRGIWWDTRPVLTIRREKKDPNFRFTYYYKMMPYHKMEITEKGLNFNSTIINKYHSVDELKNLCKQSRIRGYNEMNNANKHKWIRRLYERDFNEKIGSNKNLQDHI
uniref:Uncharacterized protein n=1 Tax=viral metagenome TaxID=1070528 RepID=A0A6C0F9V9_9ZZZZ|tara:strand:+ start:4088 stop:4600 length:513 start_codon:yes stop_codon:yes gene_type:complete